MHELILYGMQGKGLQRLRLRQGLPPILDDEVFERYRGANGTNSYPPSLAVAPDMKRLAGSTGGSGAVYPWVWGNTDDPRSSYASPSAPFGSYGLCAACSNEFYAIGGYTPSCISVYRWSDNSMLLVNISKLGVVYGMDFSPDGTKLAVVHDYGTQLRVYDTGNWSYVDAPVTAGTYRRRVAFTRDGTRIVTFGGTNPHVSVFDLELNNLIKLNDAYLSTDVSGSTMQHWFDPNKLVVCCGNSSSSYFRGFVLDAFSGQFKAFGSGAYYYYGMGYDALNNVLYVSHVYNNETGFCLTAFDGTTLLPLERQPIVLSSINSTPALAMALVRRDIHRVYGTVRDIDNHPAQRTVRAFLRETGALVAQTLSDPVTGDYVLLLPDERPVDLQFMTEPGENLNDIFFARTVSEPAPDLAPVT